MALIIFPLPLLDVYNLSCIKLQLASEVQILSGLICLASGGVAQLNSRLVGLAPSQLLIKKTNVLKIGKGWGKSLSSAGLVSCGHIPRACRGSSEEELLEERGLLLRVPVSGSRGTKLAPLELGVFIGTWCLGPCIPLLAGPDPNKDGPGGAEAQQPPPPCPGPQGEWGPSAWEPKQKVTGGSEVASHRDAKPALDILSDSKASGNAGHSTGCYRAP